MTLSTLETATINRGITVCKTILALAEELKELNDLYESGATSVKASITAKAGNGLPLATEFSGLTQAQLDDGMYAAETAIRTALENSRVQLTVLASRR